MAATTTNGTTTSIVEGLPAPAPASAAMVRVDGAAIEPQNMSELVTYAEAAATSGFFGAKNKEQALMMLGAGRDLGLSYSQALRAFHVIEQEGRPPKLCISADGMVAVCVSHPEVCAYFRIVEADDSHAIVEAQRVGDPPRRASFSVEEAQRAGLVKERGGWAKWPGRMCLARAKSFLARDLFPDLLLGLYDPDEIRDAAEPPATRRVAVEHVRPLRPEGAPAEPPDLSAAAQAYAVSIAKAATPADLKATLDAITQANLSEPERAHLRPLYDARKKEIAKAAGGAK